ncbi:MAG TPA: hypothetical protein VK477_08710 [Acidobacteriota bacterium]|nr:hypothetical protein [Acidobacteriota bacterium]
MSLNRYEQSLFDYWERQIDERRHWQMKTIEAAKATVTPGEVARRLERELWDYFRERTSQVPALRSLAPGGGQRVSMLNLAELMLRLWGPPPKPKRPAARSAE